MENKNLSNKETEKNKELESHSELPSKEGKKYLFVLYDLYKAFDAPKCPRKLKILFAIAAILISIFITWIKMKLR